MRGSEEGGGERGAGGSLLPRDAAKIINNLRAAAARTAVKSESLFERAIGWGRNSCRLMDRGGGGALPGGERDGSPSGRG